MTVHKDDDDQARANMLKTIRTLIRLKHSLAADAELNERLPQADAFFHARLQRGHRPELAEIRKAVGV